MTTIAFAAAAMQLLAPGRDHSVLSAALAKRVDAELPLFADDHDRRKTAAWLVAIAFRESSLTLDITGDHGRSFCAFQIHQSAGGTKALLTDADACVAAAFVMLRTSMRLCPSFPLAWYAHGGAAAAACSSTRAQRLSRDRMALSKRLLAEVRP